MLRGNGNLLASPALLAPNSPHGIFLLDMTQPFLQRRSPFFGLSYALLILGAFFVLAPSAFRAARLSLSKKENDVKDWLPSHFAETAELGWFAEHFVGESFVLATWDGCSGDDQRLTIFEQKLYHESDSYDPTPGMSPEMTQYYLQAKEVGAELQLMAADSSLDNWGWENEKWLATPDGVWHYITPDGRLYRWDGHQNVVAAGNRAWQKRSGSFKLKGTFITAFGDQKDKSKTNPFYNNPSLFCAPLFHTVETGVSIANELSQEGGALWPIDLTDETLRKTVAMRRAMSRLSGTLFAPAVPLGFDWSTESFRNEIPEKRRDRLPENFDVLAQQTLDSILKEKYDDSLARLEGATRQEKDDVWYAVYDAVDVPPPPRATCVLVTLTDLAKENLAFVLGRGVMGGPKGRLLQLAKESGIQPAPAPSMAPPPFDQEPLVAGSGPPLRVGGPPVDNIAIDEEGTITLVRLVGYSVLVGVVLSYLCFRSVLITMMVFTVGGTAAFLSMSFVWWTGGRVDAILMSMPSLVYVLGLSGAIHVVNYYRDEVRQNGPDGAAGRAVRHALFPCSLAALTTAIGLISLYSSNLAPIRNFGLYAAIGVVATLAILFSFLPAALSAFAPAINKDPADESDETGDQKESSVPKPKQSDEPKETWLSDMWAGVGAMICRNHALVTVSCLLLLVAGAVGLAKIRTSVQLLKLFDPESRIIDDYAWLESNFGKIVPMEVVVRVPTSMQAEQFAASDAPKTDQQKIDGQIALDMLQRVEVASRINTVVRRTLGETGLNVVGQATSADTFLPPLPEPTNHWNVVRSGINQEFLDARESLLESDYLRIEEVGPYKGSELWRVSLRVGALSDVDYGQFINTLRTAVEPVMRAYDTREVLLRHLTTAEDGSYKKLTGKERVIVVGSKTPESLEEIELVRASKASDDQYSTTAQAERLDTEAIYFATLDQLVSGERMQKGWLDPENDDRISPGTEKWDRVISGLDAVIWVGGGGVTEADFAKAKHFIDARDKHKQTVQPILTGDRIPDIVDSDDGMCVVYTGLVPVVYKAQRTLLASLVRSIGLAFVLIAAVMIMLLNPGRLPLTWFCP